MQYLINTELSSHEETRFEFNRSTGAIKLGIDVHQDFYVVVEQVGGTNPKPPQRFGKQAFLYWAARLKEKSAGAEVHAVYEACGFGFSLQRNLTALGIKCHVVCPQKLDERNTGANREPFPTSSFMSIFYILFAAMRAPARGGSACSR